MCYALMFLNIILWNVKLNDQVKLLWYFQEEKPFTPSWLGIF